MTFRFRRRRRAPALVLPGLLMLLVLSACGATSGVATIDGADDASASPSASAAPEDPEEAMFAFSECMRENGIDMPDPVIRRFEGGGGSSGVVGSEADPGDGPSFDPNSEEFQAAEEACQEHLEGLGTIGSDDGPQLSAEEEEAFLAFAECMREEGIDMPDFRTGRGEVRIGPGPGEEPQVDPRSEEFQAAEEACSEHLDALPGLERNVEVAP